MLTIVLYMTVKAGREDECAAVCRDVMTSTRSQDEGCLSYTFYRRRDNPKELMLFE
jgi:quinol monooxygenase YgiN